MIAPSLSPRSTPSAAAPLAPFALSAVASATTPATTPAAPASRSPWRLALLLPLLLMAACASTAPHQLPPVDLATDFRYAEGWQRADAQPLPLAENWWQPYADPELERLLQGVAQANADLAQARARHQQALTQIDAARAGLMPSLDASTGYTRSGSSRSGAESGTGRLYQAGLDVAWVPDLWGRTARAGAAARADAQASAATLAAARLALQLTAAQGYVRLRTLDLYDELLAQSLKAYERSLHLTERQYEAGLVARSDVIQAQTQLQSLRAQRASTARQRALEENALALLAGSTPAASRLERRAGPLPATPAIPRELPSALLVRRPDIAAAERSVAAVHAQLGIAQTAWLPTLTLGASGGLQATRWRDVFDAPTRVWSLGPSLVARLFDGGARRAEVARMEAVYEEQVQAWRASVLLGVRESEDALASILLLADEAAQQQELVKLAESNERVVTHRYEAGEITFLEVATAQNLSLQSRRAALEVEAEQLLASMRLIAALGGGWTVPENWAAVDG